MIDKAKYPKVAKDFEKWRVLNCPFHGNIGKYFHKLRPELQSGVYLRYFDKCKIYINIDGEAPTIFTYHWSFTIDQSDWIDGNGKVYNSRISALKVAIIKASDIREKELTQTQ